ncbi:OmpP1/FadL family transporter [Dysgonomonas sp. BGC7]|uniref:OmpP1/FadL family transporter n=1 Tax=Dysgonomonas sp. BGC7 TaxID=1658008 RepID=UPI0006834727|nr:hypothetical protein [Dysgonomonas sp. BGC7]MBD8389045.1 hypothetical protein [Dysgonomonas sp. BGC7]
MLKIKKLLFIALLASVIGSLSAQTDSPYSRYGYGVLRDKAVGPSKSMGGIGYGLRNSQSANPLNPASYSRVDSLTFLFDIGVSATFGKMSDASGSENKTTGGLDYITMLVPLKKGLGFSFGVLPFSSLGYKFGTSDTSGPVPNSQSFSGTGGLSQVYAGIGYSTPLKGLSVGANVSYLFGTLEYNKNLTLVSPAYSSVDVTELSIKAAQFDLGIQYELPLSKTKKLTIGAVYSPKINSKADYVNMHYDIASTVLGDTTRHNSIDAGIPDTYGLGFTMAHGNKLVWGADATYQRWSDVKFPAYMNDGLDNSNRFNDRWKYNIGAEYMIDPYDRSFFKKIKFRGGLNYSNSYMNVKAGNNIDGYKEYGATLGFGLPIKDNLGQRVSYINLNFEYKKLKPKLSNMVNEEYFGISLNVNINEFWFFRRKAE